MTLGEIVKNKSQVRIKEYERWGDGLIFIGGCYYADGKYIPLDKCFYSKCLEINAHEWNDDGTLMIVRERHDD